MSFVLGEERAGKLTNLNRLVEEINARPAAERLAAIKGKNDFKTEIDEEGRVVLSPHSVRPTA